MTALLIGLLVLVGVVQVLRWFAHTDVKTVRKTINWGGIGIILLIIAFLAVTGRIGAAIAGLVVLFGWVMRILSMVQMSRQFSAMFRSAFTGQFGGMPHTSDVESDFFAMTLNHANGNMNGEVKRGRFRGRRLSTMSLEDLGALLREVQNDADSVSLLETYLDRAHPDWREQGGGTSTPAPSGTMTAEEAYRVLGLKAGASDADVKAAYRRLMGQMHPDHGGSDYLAAKVNQAKDFLLKGRNSG